MKNRMTLTTITTIAGRVTQYKSTDPSIHPSIYLPTYHRLISVPTILNTSKKPADLYSSSDVEPTESIYKQRPIVNNTNVAIILTIINGMGGITTTIPTTLLPTPPPSFNNPRSSRAMGREAAQPGKIPMKIFCNELVDCLL